MVDAQTSEDSVMLSIGSWN